MAIFQIIITNTHYPQNIQDTTTTTTTFKKCLQFICEFMHTRMDLCPFRVIHHCERIKRYI